MEKKELEIILHTLEENNWDLSNLNDIEGVSFDAMSFIGSTDSELRESIFSLLYTAIVNDHLGEESLRNLLEEAMSDHHGNDKLGKSLDDSVFDRSFAMLVTRWIVHQHRVAKKGFLKVSRLEEILAFTCDYTSKENDYRGYTTEKGWAHSIAHAATCLRTLALCEEINKVGLMKILTTIKNKVSIYEHVYVADEMERWTMCVMNVLRRNLIADEELCKWIQEFAEPSENLESHNRMNLRINQTNFLRALYFRCIFKKDEYTFIPTLYAQIQSLNAFHNEMEE